MGVTSIVLHQHTLPYWFMIMVCLISACTPDNVALGPNNLATETNIKTEIEVEAARDGVFITQNGERQMLPVTERVILTPGQSVTVDETGRAILHFGNILTLELLQLGQVEVKQFNVAAENTVIRVKQNNGVLVAEFTPTAGIEANLLVQTSAALINAHDKVRFGVVHETNSPLQWVLGLEAGEGSLSATVDNSTQPIVGGQARWVAQNAEPGPIVPINKNAEAWLSVVRNSTPETELGEVLLPLANMLVDAGDFTALPVPGETIQFALDDILGPLLLTLDQQGIFGNPNYLLQDCDGDNIQDIVMINGSLTLDFSQMLARVQGLEVIVLNRDEPGQGVLQILDAAGMDLGQQQMWVGDGTVQTLSLRTNQPQHQAKLVVSNACLLGLTLTPSTEPVAEQAVSSASPLPTPNTQTTQNDAVVNILATNSERSPQNGEFQAPSALTIAGNNLITIDGNQNDWDTLAQQSGIDWTSFSTITYNNNCDQRYPDSGSLTDLSGRVQLAYDDQNLYLAFIVNDDGFVPYLGPDDRYFLGDSPQLLLDLDLNGDFDNPKLTADDIQIDLYPDFETSRAVLWQLSTLSSQSLTAALIKTVPTDTGYFLEASIPWQLLHIEPQPGDRLGIVASISDNDTPDTDNQECIISTSPKRDWRNPTTWGTILLTPPQQ